MRIPPWIWVGGGAALIWGLSRTQNVQSIITQGEDTVTAALAGWKSVQDGPVWVPILNAAEQQYNLPTDLLARIAYQESHFRPDIITGATVSPAGALGLMQLMPQYFKTVQVPRPYSADDTSAQINEAAQLLSNLYNQFQDWGLAVAAYNDGAGNIQAFISGTKAMPAETQTYVSNILADVPLPTTLQA